MSEPSRHTRRPLDRKTEDLAARYLDAVLGNDGHAAEELLGAALRDGIAAATAFTRIVQPAMEEVGRRWQRGDLAVADEHLATAITKRALAAVYPRLIADAPQRGPRVVLAGVEGDLHSIGLRMVSDVLDEAGFETAYLGPDVPAAELAGAVARHDPRLVAVSATMPDHAAALERTIAVLVRRHPAVSIMVGGRGVPSRLHGYAGYTATAEDAVTVARRLTAGEPVLPDPRPAVAAAAAAPRPEPLERGLSAEAGRLGELAREQARRAREYRSLALTDPHTGLPNRRAWDERYEAVGATGDVVLLVVDLDHFKAVNDRDGHLAGDAVLARAATAIRSALRGQDFVARLGGDEFGVLLPDTDDAGGQAIADRVRQAIARDLADTGVTATIGVARHVTDRRATMLAADQALYRGKGRGGDVVGRA